VTPCLPNGSNCRPVPADVDTTATSFVQPFDIDTPDWKADTTTVEKNQTKRDSNKFNGRLVQQSISAGDKGLNAGLSSVTNATDSELMNRVVWEEGSKNIASKKNVVSVLLANLLEKTPPPPPEKSMLTVLVSDTPVSDYCLTYRQRVIKNSRLHARLRRLQVT
jgi:hypothetical protein